jgi:hypothetical protein
MEPYRTGEKPMEVYNRTEVELARIREQEETKRRIVSDREKTKQTARSADGYWVVRGLAVVGAAVSVIAVCVAGYNSYSDKMHAEHPAFGASGCVESAQIVTSDNSQKTCDHGGWFEALPTNKVGEVLIRCHCSPRPATPPPASSAP